MEKTEAFGRVDCAKTDPEDVEGLVKPQNMNPDQREYYMIYRKP